MDNAQGDEKDVVSSAKVAELLRARVRSGYLAPGQRLVESDLMRDTGASRGRVREALQRLAVEGLVVIQEFRGASVKRLTREEAEQTYRAREVLEGLCARLVAEKRPSEVLAELRSLQSQMDTCEAEADNDTYPPLNERWHELIISAAENDLARTFLQRLRIPIFAIQFRRLFSLRALKKSNLVHREVTAAIERGDGEAAERHMRYHIREALEDLSKHGDDMFEASS